MIGRIFRLLTTGVYRFLTRKAFYVTGTFIDDNGTRMFCNSTFLTYGNILPIRELEKSMKESMGVKNNIIILHINRIPYGMVKYIKNDYSERIIVEPHGNK